MNNIEEKLLKSISKQVTDNVPKLYIQDINSGRVFEYGKNCHDKLIISEDGRCLTYYNLQCGDGSCVGDYRFYYEKPKIETEEDKRYAYDIDEWARMVKHQSIKELLAEEIKRVVQEIREPIIKSLENGIVRKNPKSSNTNLRDIILFQMLEILDQIERGE